MVPYIRAATVVLLAASVFSSSAEAGRGALAASRKAQASAPIKDCTRLNGRFGYYGNPWCTPAEQKRWDKWQARHLRR